jgi:hypothetical protein
MGGEKIKWQEAKKKDRDEKYNWGSSITKIWNLKKSATEGCVHLYFAKKNFWNINCSLKKSQPGDESWGQIIGDNYIILFYNLIPCMPHTILFNLIICMICRTTSTSVLK